jgi:hypothetical protein
VKIFRKTDGYVEVAAIPEGRMVEIYITSPGQDSSVVSAHMPDKLALRLALWLLIHCVFVRFCGLKSWLEARRERELLFQDARTEDLSRD